MTKEKRAFFRQLGRESYKAAEPCIPYKSRRLTDCLYQDGVRDGAVVNKEHLIDDCEAMKEWTRGWTNENLKFGGEHVG